MNPQTFKRATPKWVRSLVPQSLKDRLLKTTRLDVSRLPSMKHLRALLSAYHVRNLVNANPVDFHSRIEAFSNLQDAAMEGFADPSLQRDRSIKFYWSNDLDFGDFQITGLLRDRHISLIAALIDWFPVFPESSLHGKTVLDIGCCLHEQLKKPLNSNPIALLVLLLIYQGLRGVGTGWRFESAGATFQLISRGWFW